MALSDPVPAPVESQLPQPEVRQGEGFSLIWLLPLLTALLGGWLIYKTLSEQGPEVTLTFKSADNIVVGKTEVRYKSVTIGRVEALRLNDDLQGVTLTLSFTPESAPLLLRNSHFWVVRPRLSLRGVSGLGTLVSGAYIELEPGAGLPQRHFTGLESPPVVRAGSEGKNILLMADNLGSVDNGSPIYYQGIMAGEVLTYELGSDRRSLFIHAFIRAPYDQLIGGNTRFWNISGVDLAVGADGIQLQTSSLQSLLYGGIAFDNPQQQEVISSGAAESLIYTLYPNQRAVNERSYSQKLRFVLFFERSVRGLSVGAPVEFKGIKVGNVTDITLEYDLQERSFHIPVTIEIEPERVLARHASDKITPNQMVQQMVEHGLRAQLQTGSLLTGQLFVQLDLYPDTPVRLTKAGGTLPELPTIPGSIEQMTQSVQSFLAQLEKVDVVRLGNELISTLAGVNGLVNGGELQQSLVAVNSSMQSLRSLLAKLDGQVTPLVSDVNAAVVAGGALLNQSEQTMQLLNTMLQPDAPAQFHLNQLMLELGDAARAVRTLVELLQRNPESLLYGKK
ncbi:MAG: MCE family protein [Gammaproteobacteria bacterium]|nr:MCE family protein [Gammaproteobacteria bacterium]